MDLSEAQRVKILVSPVNIYQGVLPVEVALTNQMDDSASLCQSWMYFEVRGERIS